MATRALTPGRGDIEVLTDMDHALALLHQELRRYRLGAPDTASATTLTAIVQGQQVTNAAEALKLFANELGDPQRLMGTAGAPGNVRDVSGTD